LLPYYTNSDLAGNICLLIILGILCLGSNVSEENTESLSQIRSSLGRDRQVNSVLPGNKH